MRHGPPKPPAKSKMKFEMSQAPHHAKIVVKLPRVGNVGNNDKRAGGGLAEGNVDARQKRAADGERHGESHGLGSTEAVADVAEGELP